MANIIDFRKYQETNSEELDYILSMPDDLFRTIFPTVKEETIKAFKGELSSNLESSHLDEDTRNALENEMNKAMEMINSPEAKEELSKEKLEYLELLIECTKSVLNNIPLRETVKIKIELCDENAKIPTYSNPTDAGCDVYAKEDQVIEAKQTVLVKTGLKVAIPCGWMLSVRPRSGMSLKTGLRVANAPGTIDSGYRDEVGIIIHNTSESSYTIHQGDRIAQLVIEPAPMIHFEQVESVSEIGENRGGGFGHTGD